VRVRLLLDDLYTAGQDRYSNGDFTLWSLTANLHFDAFSITSATSNLEGVFGINIPLSPSGSFSSQFLPKMFAQELRVYSTTDGPFHWVAGAAYQDGQGPQVNALVLPGLLINADNNTLTENWAVFGEVSYDLLDGKLVPLIGLRTYHDDRAFADSNGTVPTKASVETWRPSPTSSVASAAHVRSATPFFFNSGLASFTTRAKFPSWNVTITPSFVVRRSASG
jgi:hypothetical protein